ncbi:coil containing protein [Vibrio phage 381E49-1]|nr:coil containing protein [Vibrio phage 381E49-1]
MELTLMTINEYEDKFYDQLASSQPDGVKWHVWVNRCYQSFMDSVAEQELDMELNQL